MNAELLTGINWFIHCQIWKYIYIGNLKR